MTTETTATDAAETESGAAATAATDTSVTTSAASTDTSSTASTDSTTAAAATDAETQAAAVAAAVAAAPATTAAAPTVYLTLRQWAMEQSARDKRVALLHGFVHSETQARHFKDTPENFAARYATFATTPLN
jgi:hypothetical protein